MQKQLPSDRKAERGFGLRQELVGILRHAQGVGGHGADSPRVEVAQAFAKARQGIDAALLRCTIKLFVRSQPGREPYRLLEAVEWINLVGHNAPDLKAKTVRAEIHRGYQFVGHGEF